MGHRKEKHEKKVATQKANKLDNERYYQNGTKQKDPRSESEQRRDRTP